MFTANALVNQIVQAYKDGKKCLFLYHESNNPEEFYVDLALGVDACQLSAISKDVNPNNSKMAHLDILVDAMRDIDFFNIFNKFNIIKQTHQIALLNFDLVPDAYKELAKEEEFMNSAIKDVNPLILKQLMVFVIKKPSEIKSMSEINSQIKSNKEEMSKLDAGLGKLNV